MYKNKTIILYLIYKNIEINNLCITNNNNLYKKMNKIVYNNRADILIALEKNDNSSILKYASQKLRNKKNIVMIVIKKNWKELEYASFRLRNNVDFMLDALTINGSALQYATNYLKNNGLIVLTGIKNNTYAIRHASYNIKNSKAFAMLIIINFPEIFQFLSDNLKNDKDIIRIVITKYNNKKYSYYDIFKNISYELKNDKDFMLELIKLDIHIINYASYKIKNDPDIILNIMTNDKNIFKLNNDINIKFPYIKYILHNVSNNLLHNKDFIKSIIEKCQEAFEYIPEDLKNDKDFIFELLDEGYTTILDYISEDLKNDKDFIITIIEKYDDFILFKTSPEIKNNFDVVKCSVNKYGMSLEFASDNLKDNEIIVTMAIEKHIHAIIYASDRLKQDKTFVIKCLKIDKGIINLIESTKLYNIFYDLEYNNQDKTIIKKQLLFFWNKIQYFKYLTNIDQYIINISKQYYNECFTNKNILLNMYNCEEVLEILKHKCDIIILALQDINLGNDYDIDILKQGFIERYPNKKIHFF
jgi:hypothetical protein